MYELRNSRSACHLIVILIKTGSAAKFLPDDAKNAPPGLKTDFRTPEGCQFFADALYPLRFLKKRKIRKI